MAGLLLLLWAACGAAAAWIASEKRHNAGIWLLIGFMFGPLAVIAAFIMEARADDDDAGSIDSGDRRPCPYCREPIHWDAIKCQHCGSDVEPMERDMRLR